MALAADQAQLSELHQQQQQHNPPGATNKRASEGSKQSSKQGRSAFGDITNRRNKENVPSTKGTNSISSVAALAVPSTTGTTVLDVPSPAPTPSHLIKRIRFSDKFQPESAPPAQPQQQAWVDIDKDNAKLVGLTCPTYVASTFHQLRVAETRKRPSPTYMDTVQNDINASMRSILVDWLVEVAAEYKLHSDTLFLTISYIDRYLSVVPVQRSELQLVGVACMLVASKYEEIYAPTVEDFCYITDHTYSREQLLAAEQSVLGALRFEVTAPTAKTFLRRFLEAAAAEQRQQASVAGGGGAAAGGGSSSGCGVTPLQQQLQAQGLGEQQQGLGEQQQGQQQQQEPDTRLLELTAAYLAELSLLEYSMLPYLPSQVAAAAVLVALALLGQEGSWRGTLEHYTGYAPRDLRRPAAALHTLLVRAGSAGHPPAVKEKYGHEELERALLRMDALPEALFQ